MLSNRYGVVPVRIREAGSSPLQVKRKEWHRTGGLTSINLHSRLLRIRFLAGQESEEALMKASKQAADPKVIPERKVRPPFPPPPPAVRG
ncbi:MAG: hypothetical protein JWM59_1736 [Verrucomicrobiales bacterium]|nr:hypothetical protein [Verrucomicrobiales bacterium]